TPSAGMRGATVLPSPTPPTYSANSPSKEYVYAGSKLLAVSEPLVPVPSDLAVWRLSTGTWYVMDVNGPTAVQGWGVSTDIAAPGDYDGDGKTDFCVFRPSEGAWYILESGSGSMNV